MADAEETYNKPSYDGRLEFYRHLRQYWDGLQNSVTEGNIDLWYRYLRGYYSRTHSYIQPKKRTEIKEAFKQAINSMLVLNSGSNLRLDDRNAIEFQISNQLQDIEDLLFEATKELLLPIKVEVDGDFDIEEFMRQSDLAG